MILTLSWNNPKITIGEFDTFLSSYLGDNYDGMYLENSWVNILTKEDMSAGQEEYVRNYFYTINDMPIKTSITNLAIQTTGELKVSNNVTEGSSVFLVSHDFCDKTTWWSESVRVEGAELSADLLHLTYTSDHEYWIDLKHGKVPYEANYASTYKPHVYVDGQEVTTGFTINYVDGTVTFNSSKVGHTITATYSYANGSNWVITPSSGKFLRMLGAEIKFAKNVILDDGQQIAFQIYVNSVCVSEVIYKSVKDLIKCIVGNPHIIPAFGGLTHDTVVLPYNYITVKDLKSSLNMQVKIGLKTDAPLTGEWGSMSVSCLSITE